MRREKQRLEITRLVEARKNYKLCLNCGNDIKQVFMLISSTELCESCLSYSLSNTILTEHIRDINASSMKKRSRRYG